MPCDKLLFSGLDLAFGAVLESETALESAGAALSPPVPGGGAFPVHSFPPLLSSSLKEPLHSGGEAYPSGLEAVFLVP